MKDKFNLKSLLGSPNALLASIRDTINRGGRYWRWGEQDNFPNIILDSANDSGTARDCIDKLETFIKGKGLSNKEFLKRKANPSQTWGELLEEIDSQISYIEAITLRIIYNAGGKVAEVYFLPVQNIRRRYDGQFVYGDDLGDPQGYRMFAGWNREIIPAFGTHKDGPSIRKMIAEQMAEHGKQIGELLYIYKPGIGLNYRFYPVPKWSAGLHDINADAGLSLHEESQVSNSFKGGAWIQTRELDKKTIGEDGLTEYERFQQVIEEAQSPDAGDIIHTETLNNDGATANITPLNIQHQMDATEKATERVAKKVCRLFGVPPILLGIETAGKLGNNQELVNYMKLFNLTIEKKKELKSRMFEKLFPEEFAMNPEQFETVPLQIFDFVPDELIKRLPIGVLAKMYNIEVEIEEDAKEGEPGQPGAKRVESPAREVNEHLKTLTGKQQQQLDRIVRKFGKDELTLEQATLQLTTGFGFTEDEARVYLNIKDDEIEEGAEGDSESVELKEA